MPELPEVETVRRGLEPLLTGARIEKVTLNRPDLRFAFPPRFAARLSGQTIVHAGRRAKYLLFTLSGGETLLCHLGMTGSFHFARPDAAGGFGRHGHVIFDLVGTPVPAPHLVYTDPRRFGFMDMFAQAADCAYLAGLGPEPLGNALSADFLAARLAGRAAPVKSLLLDQRVVAGLGNIYACEALHLARVHPQTPGNALVTGLGAPTAGLEALVPAIRQVLEAAIASGGSTLRDYRNVDGGTGYFQHSFNVYGHEGDPCRRPDCGGTVRRIVQAGRSTFFCPRCQPKKRAGTGVRPRKTG